MSLKGIIIDFNQKTVASIEIDGDDYGTLALRVTPNGCEMFLPYNIVKALLNGDEAHFYNSTVGLDLEIDLDGLSKAWQKAF